MRVRLRVVLFDVDDTLYDRELAQTLVAVRLAEQFSELFTGKAQEEVIRAFVQSDQIATRQFEVDGLVNSARAGRMEVFLGLLGLGTGRANELAARYVSDYPRVDAPVAGAREVVEALAREFRLGVVSNGISDVQYQKLETLGIRHLFDCIVLSEEFGVRKPDPSIFWRAAELLAVPPRECLYVGDSYQSDVLGAQGAGMSACWFNPRRLSVPPGAAAPDFGVASLHEILQRLAVYRPEGG